MKSTSRHLRVGEVDELIARFPYDAHARARLVAFRESDDFDGEELGDQIEWLVFSAIDGSVAEDPVAWAEAACDEAFPDGYDFDDRTEINRVESIPKQTWEALELLWTEARARKNPKEALSWSYIEKPRWTATSGFYARVGVYALIKYTPKATKELRLQAIEDFKKRALPVGRAMRPDFLSTAEFEQGIPSNYGDYYTQALWMRYL